MRVAGEKFSQLFPWSRRAHQRLADQKNMHAELFDPPDLLETIDAALAHWPRGPRHERRQPLRRRQAHREGFKSRLLIPITCAPAASAGIQLFFGMHLDQHING